MKKYIAAILLILLLIVLGVIYYEKYFTKTNSQTAFTSDFVVTETPAEKIVTNKQAGMTMTVPKDWYIEQQNSLHTPISFYPGTAKNCKITASISLSDFKNNSEIENFFNTDEDYKVGVSVQDKKISNIDFHGNEAVKVYLLGFGGDYTQGVKFLKNFKEYTYILYGVVNEKNVCDSLFQSYLDSVKFE